ncbi:DUF3558 domain-containing protein [Saccharomonospora xinjiangensis]|uniref:DUF3558 domain-containing protein n=1 Tax=Saccharomonospora xinjiangensis TaxID=75294 RepID=UPI003510CF3B
MKTSILARIGMVTCAALLLAVVGCSGGEKGLARPQTSSAISSVGTTTGPSSSASLSASLHPCDLLSAEDLIEVGKFDSKYKEGGGARSCYWQRNFENGGDGFLFTVSVRDAQSLETLRDDDEEFQQTEVNQRPAASSKDPEFGDCTFAMKIDGSSRVDINVAGDDRSDAACDVARAIANLVEPRLPDLQ